MRAAFVLLCLGGCPKPSAAPVLVAPPDDVPVPRTDVVAGPRAVVDEAHPPPLEADQPGGGPLPPYLNQVRSAVMERYTDCIGDVDTSAATPAVVTASISDVGDVRSVTVRRSSGLERVDSCLVRAFRDGKVPAPPAEVLGDDRALTAEWAFR